jgi:uncharacterized protein (TIGR02231 family)
MQQKAEASFGGEFAEAKEELDDEVAQRPSVHDFGALELGAPDDAGRRGRLRSIDRRARYLETLQRSGLDIGFDPIEVVERADRRARQAASTSLPGGAIDIGEVDSPYDFAYEADDRVDVSADGVFHTVPLDSREAPCELRYVVVPREDRSVYRQASIENPSRAPMLPGPVEVYIDGDFVLQSSLPTVAPRERFELGLGVEQAIVCARNTHYREERSGGDVVATTELRHRLEIELRNQLGRSIACEVRERIPQPAPEAEVVVEEGEVRPEWEAYDQEERGVVLEGGRRWEVTVEPGQSEELVAEYILKIYANNEIVGGNRREE